MNKVLFFGTAILREIAYFFTYPILNKIYHPRIRKIPATKGKIILVESWFQKNPYHKVWSTYLEKKGFDVYLVNFSNMMEEFPTSAKKLHTFIEKHALSDFTLVGISTGALICLEYLQTYESWNSIKRFISVAAPFKGTPRAMLISYTKKGKAMVPSSPFLTQLFTKPIPKNKMVTISAEVDELVPKESSVLPGVKSIVLPAIGHNVLHLDYQQTYDKIAELSENE